MRRKFQILLVALACVASFSSSAMTGNKLKEHSDHEPGLDRGIFYGYIAGILDARFKEICIPDGVSNGQAIDVVHKFMEENPEILHLAADDIVIAAVQKAWPCK